MQSIRSLWRHEKPARWFFLAHLQGSLGANAGYIALLLLAYEQIGSAWAATAVLLADLLPAMLLGPLLGSLIDRTSRLGAAIAADLIRAAAFGALIFCDGIAPMIALALLAGVGTALFRPATYALLPGLVRAERIPAANAAFAAIRDSGMLVGPLLAAAVIAVTSPGLVLGLNALTFAVSGLLLLNLRGKVRAVAAPPTDEATAPASLRTVLASRPARAMILTSGAVTLCAATMNVGELILAQRDLDAGSTGFALLVTAYGVGLIGGALFAGRDGGDVRRRYFAGLAMLATGMVATAVAPNLGFALLTFAFTGVANGLFGPSNRSLLHRTIPEHVHGRAFGLVDSLDAWAFGIAVIAGGALATAFGGRAVFGLAGTVLFVVWAAAALAQRAAAPPDLLRSPGMVASGA